MIRSEDTDGIQLDPTGTSGAARNQLDLTKTVTDGWEDISSMAVAI